MLRDDGHERASSFCTGGTCLGVSLEGDTVSISDRSDSGGATVQCRREEWTAFLAGVKNGEFDLPDA